MVMVTLTVSGVWCGWLRLWSEGIWPVILSHLAFDNLMEGVAGAAIPTSPAMLAYLTTETGAGNARTAIRKPFALLTDPAPAEGSAYEMTAL